jgi:hypothetical protein
MKGAITVAGSLAQKPLQGGHSWVLLQYLLGFRRLGWKVLFLDDLTPEMCFDGRARPCPPEQSLNLQVFRSMMDRFGLQDDCSLIFNGGEKFFGRSRKHVLEHVRDSAFLLNVMGYLTNEEILGQAARLVFLDIDPGFGQMWERLGLGNLFEGHDDHVTIGERIGTGDCRIPTCGLSWITTPQPVVLSQWPARIDESCRQMTSIISWRGAYGPVAYQGRSYGLRAHEFRKFIDLPRRTRQKFRLALKIHPNDSADLKALEEHRWEIVDPSRVAGDPWAYRKFIQNSASELMVAKNMYVDTQSGWFSDRSICYLASGKPVLAQNTGLDGLLPVGEGLLLFRTLDEAVEGVKALQSDYVRHARSARAIAEECFDSDKVLAGLLGKLGVN